MDQSKINNVSLTTSNPSGATTLNWTASSARTNKTKILLSY